MKDSSKFNSREEWEEYIWGRFLKSINDVKNEKKLKRILESVISKKEKRLIIKRIIAISLIKNGKTYREIGETLYLSPVTVSALKKSLYAGISYAAASEVTPRQDKNKQVSKENFWAELTIELLDLILSPPFPTTMGRVRREFPN